MMLAQRCTAPRAVASPASHAKALPRRIPEQRSAPILLRRTANGGDWNHSHRGFSASASGHAFGPSMSGRNLSRLALGVAMDDDASAQEEKKEAISSEDLGGESGAGDELEPPSIEAKYVIIGSGTASYSAIKAIKEMDPDAKIVVISEEFYLPYQRPPLSKDLWKTDDPEVAIHLKFKDWAGKEASVFYENESFWSEANGITYLRVESNVLLSPERRMIQLPDGRKVLYEKCLIATGAKPFTRFNGDWELSEEVTTFRNLEDFQLLHSLTKTGGKKVTVAGGGFLGSELAWALARSATGAAKKNEIVQIVPETGIMANLFPQYLSDYVTAKLRDAGVDIRTGRMVKEIKREPGRVTVTLDNNETIVSDHLASVLATGVVPDTRVANFAELELDPTNKGIVVNAELQARSDLFAAGDVASYYDFFLGRRRVEHYDHAVESGKLAGQNMVGMKKPYTHLPMFWGDLGSDGYEAVGVLDSRLQTVSVWETPESGTVSGEQKPEYKKGAVYFLSKDSRVVGVLLWNMFGKVEDARATIRRIKRYEDLNDLKWAIDFAEGKH